MGGRSRPTSGGYSLPLKAAFWAVAVLLLTTFSEGTLATGTSEGQDEQRDSTSAAVEVYVCAIHPQVQMAAPGRCPICLLDLVARAPDRVVGIPEGKLREFCEDYVVRSVERREGGLDIAQHATRAYTTMKGEAAIPRLREMLGDRNLYWVSAAAYHLGELEDRASIPELKRLLSSPRLRASADALAPIIVARSAVAGALYRMAQAEGLDVLLQMAAEGYGPWAYGALALRDTEEARAALVGAASADDRHGRAAAIAGLVRLGRREYVPEAIELLGSGDGQVVTWILETFAELPEPSAEGALLGYLDKKDSPDYQRLLAAGGLVRLGRLAHRRKIIDAVAGWGPNSGGGVALHLLGEFGTAEHLLLLKDIIERDHWARPAAVAAALRVMQRESTQKNKADQVRERSMDFPSSQSGVTMGAGQVIDAGGLTSAMTPKEEFRRWLDRCQETYDALEDYTYRFVKRERIAGKLLPEEVARVKFKKPMMVYMRWVGKVRKGQECMYVRGQYDDKLVARGTGLAGIVTVELDPNGNMAMRNSRHPITDTGIGNLLQLLRNDYQLATRHEEGRVVDKGTDQLSEHELRVFECILPADKSYCQMLLMRV